jgi:hypothetical protein
MAVVYLNVSIILVFKSSNIKRVKRGLINPSQETVEKKEL